METPKKDSWNGKTDGDTTAPQLSDAAGLVQGFHKLNLMLFMRRVSRSIHIEIQNQILQGRI